MEYAVIIFVALAVFGWAAYKLSDGHIFWTPVSTAAPTRFPYVLETRLIPVKGNKRWVRLEVYEHTVQIIGGRPESILALIRIEDVLRVAYQDRSADGLPMAGLSLVTTRGQYIFFSEGFTAPNKMKRTAFVIRSVYKVVTGEELAVADLDLGRLTADNIVH